MDKKIFENLAVDNLCNKGYNMAKKLDLGLSSTGCEEQSLSVSILLYHCSCNDVMFDDNKFNVFNEILNNI